MLEARWVKVSHRHYQYFNAIHAIVFLEIYGALLIKKEIFCRFWDILILEDILNRIPSVRGSPVYKSPLDDTTSEAFPVSCTSALALTAMRSLTPAFPVSPRSPLLPCHCTVFPCAGLWSAVLSRGDHHGSLRTPAGEARHGAGPSRATAIRAMKIRCRGSRRHTRGSTSHTLSPKEKLMKIISMTLLTLLLLPLSGWSTDLNLFVIQRSKNTNEVQYQLHVNDRCQIVSDHPVDAFWQLREVSPESTEPLSDLEYMAYGVINQKVAEHWVSFDLRILEYFRALEQRSITATVRYDPHTATCTSIVQTTINGQVAALERIYVQADERLVRPKVRYIDVFGKSVASRPTPVKERIDP